MRSVQALRRGNSDRGTGGLNSSVKRPATKPPGSGVVRHDSVGSAGAASPGSVAGVGSDHGAGAMVGAGPLPSPRGGLVQIGGGAGTERVEAQGPGFDEKAALGVLPPEAPLTSNKRAKRSPQVRGRA